MDVRLIRDDEGIKAQEDGIQYPLSKAEASTIAKVSTTQFDTSIEADEILELLLEGTA